MKQAQAQQSSAQAMPTVEVSQAWPKDTNYSVQECTSEQRIIIQIQNPKVEAS